MKTAAFVNVSHVLNRNCDGYTRQVQRLRRIERGRIQYRYFGLVTRNSDLAQVRVSIETLRTQYSFIRFHFDTWLKTAAARNDAAGLASTLKKEKFTAIAPVKTASPNVRVINSELKAKVVIKIDEVLEGSPDQVYDRIYELVRKLEDAAEDINP